MKTSIRKKLAVAALMATSLFASASASAGLLQTTTQTNTFNFATLNLNTALAFNGFNANLGTLNSVHLLWTISTTLNDVVTNSTSSPQVVGSLIGAGNIDLTATAQTTFNGSGLATGLTGTNTSTTAGFTGTVPANVVGQIVNSVTQTAVNGSTCLSNDSSCSLIISNLASYIGGLNLFNIVVQSVGFQGGSVPAGVTTGNTGSASGTVSLFYDYTSSVPPVPTPGTLALLGLGLIGLTVMRRKSMI